MFLKKNIHTVATGLLGSLPRCSTTFFMTVEMVEGAELLGGATVVGVVVVELRVVLTAIFTTWSITSLTTAVMLKAEWPAWSVVFTTEEMTGAVELLSTSS